MGDIIIIPARGGSKGIRRKNLQEIAGKSLVEIAIRTALRTGKQVCVSSDSEEVLNVARANDAIPLKRPLEISGDEASSESAVLHCLESLGLESGVAVLMQCTSPFTRHEELTDAIEKVKSGEFDSVFSSSKDTAFRWSADPAGNLFPLGHPADQRPRRQDLPDVWAETGSFYAFDIPKFLTNKYRFFGRVGQVETTLNFPIDIDTPDELELARILAMNTPSFSYDDSAKWRKIKAVAYDFDGVMTDNHVTLDQTGRESVTCSRSDGYGVSLLKAAGVAQVIVSREANSVVRCRAEKLGIEFEAPCFEKWYFLERWAKHNGLRPEEIAFIGNDENDVECMRNVGLSLAVSDAHPSCLGVAGKILTKEGGKGAVREFADLLLRYNS